MKKLITETSKGAAHIYQIYATLSPVNDVHLLRFSSVWSGAANPTDEQNKFEMYLNKEAIENLKQLLDIGN